MQQSPIYHVRSGRVGPLAPLYVLFAGGAGVAASAALYAVVIHYNPFIYFSFLATLIFGALIGIAASSAAQAGKSRSLPFNLLATLVLVAFGLWASWLLWIALTLDRGGATASQLALADVAQWQAFFDWLAEHYRTSISRHMGAGTPSEPASANQMLWQWGLEAALVALAALFSAWVGTGTRVYSERCGGWAEQALKLEVDGHDTAPAALRAAFERGDFTQLEQLLAVDAGAPRETERWKSFELELIAETADPTLRVLNLDALDNHLDAKGKLKQSRQTVVERLLLPPAVYDALMRRLRPST
ncbi:hypothetical protein ACFDR9_001111 [Janthinobacterium sp. CG_23.3]|uniref:hypothetical protein n=1 Tax=unclassified Janthinobacterium TaxID=2610881 RepID=UPI00034C8FB0|nr:MULTISPECIES: hypothetical protein [unclassified Janthinobacterium]MEC5163746.1 hypothetical protein [Janthinobacterium sp. CG_S6]